MSDTLLVVWDAFANRVASYRRGDRNLGEILHVSLNGSDLDNQRIDFEQPINVSVVFRLRQQLENPTLAIYITDKTGQLIVGTNTGNEGLDLSGCQPGRIWSLTFTFNNRLREDRYALQVYLADVVGNVQTEFIDYLEMVLPFQSVGSSTAKRWAWFTPYFSTQLTPLNGGQP
jgi:lipopolysaccharide transport system ATP-binding protein